MLGTGLIGLFYTMTLHGQRGRDRVSCVYSRDTGRAQKFANEWDIEHAVSDMAEAVHHPSSDVVVIGLPNHLHEEAIRLCIEANKAVLCTKPLARSATEAKRILDIVELSGIFAGYLEDLVYTPKTLKALESVHSGALGEILWTRSRETHSGPHSSWFWDVEQAGGGAIIDLGCHCIEIIRSFIGKDIRPMEVNCWADTLVHPINAEDNGIGLIRFENGAIGQFEVSWSFRGGMDLRDEVAGTEGTIWLNHFLRTGFEMFSSGAGGYVAEKAEKESGWLFPVGDEVHELGYTDMFTDMFNAMDEGREPRETFYDGYIVNAVMDACYRSAKSKKWESVELEDWRGRTNVKRIRGLKKMVEGFELVKRERLPDGKVRLILKNPDSGEVTQQFVEEDDQTIAERWSAPRGHS